MYNECMNKAKIKRLIIDIPESIHNKIKAEAALRNITMRKWMLRIIIIELNRTDKYK